VVSITGKAGLRNTYRGKWQPLSLRMRSIKKAFPFEAPEPAIVAQVTDDDSFDDDSFAERLERALARRRQQPKLIEHSDRQR
jgi:hypothetical protein